MNKFQIAGRLAKDIKIFNNGGSHGVGMLTIVAQQQFVSKKTGKRGADAPQVKWFLKTEKQLDMAKKFFTKGVFVTVDGHIATGSYEKDGKTIYTTDLVVDNANAFLAKHPHQAANASEAADASEAKEASEQVPMSDEDVPF